MTKLKNILKAIKDDLGLAVIAVLAAVLRFVNLGYSDFQGDEIKALFLPDSSQSWYDFLLTQRKGPVQFLITFLIKFADPSYTNQFLVRLPFAIAGFLAVIYFYKLIKNNLGKNIAFFAAFFMATNGFFLAFSRIVQYQSFVILFAVLAMFYFDLATRDQKYRTKGIYVGFLFWALSILSHYDGIFFAPVLGFQLLNWIKVSSLTKKATWTVIAKGTLLFIFLNLAFYIPFALFLSQNTTDYWLGRLSGDVSSKLSSSYYLFTVYQPIYVIHFYLVFFAMSIFALVASFINKPVKLLTTLDSNEARNKALVVLLWFIVPFVFWEAVVYISGTHIYTYLLPVFVLLAIGLLFTINIWLAISKKMSYIKPVLIKNIFITLIILFITAQSYVIFVDNKVEYPWQTEKFLLWTFPPPTPVYHLSMFGFPYYRDWESIQEFINKHPDVTHYSTNERESISRHYISLQKDTDQAGFFVYIRNPQSFTEHLVHEKVLYWASKYPPIYTLSRDGLDLVNIYLMESGSLAELRLRGL